MAKISTKKKNKQNKFKNFRGYFCYILANYLVSSMTRYHSNMCSKKVVKQSMAKKWVCHSPTTSLQFSGLLRVMVPGTQSLQALTRLMDGRDTHDENHVSSLCKALSKSVADRHPCRPMKTEHKQDSVVSFSLSLSLVL